MDADADVEAAVMVAAPLAAGTPHNAAAAAAGAAAALMHNTAVAPSMLRAGIMGAGDMLLENWLQPDDEGRTEVGGGAGSRRAAGLPTATHSFDVDALATMSRWVLGGAPIYGGAVAPGVQLRRARPLSAFRGGSRSPAPPPPHDPPHGREGTPDGAADSGTPAPMPAPGAWALAAPVVANPAAAAAAAAPGPAAGSAFAEVVLQPMVAAALAATSYDSLPRAVRTMLVVLLMCSNEGRRQVYYELKEEWRTQAFFFLADVHAYVRHAMALDAIHDLAATEAAASAVRRRSPGSASAGTAAPVVVGSVTAHSAVAHGSALSSITGSPHAPTSPVRLLEGDVSSAGVYPAASPSLMPLPTPTLSPTPAPLPCTTTTAAAAAATALTTTATLAVVAAPTLPGGAGGGTPGTLRGTSPHTGDTIVSQFFPPSPSPLPPSRLGIAAPLPVAPPRARRSEGSRPRRRALRNMLLSWVVSGDMATATAFVRYFDRRSPLYIAASPAAAAAVERATAAARTAQRAAVAHLSAPHTPASGTSSGSTAGMTPPDPLSRLLPSALVTQLMDVRHVFAAAAVEVMTSIAGPTLAAIMARPRFDEWRTLALTSLSAAFPPLPGGGVAAVRMASAGDVHLADPRFQMPHADAGVSSQEPRIMSQHPAAILLSAPPRGRLAHPLPVDSTADLRWARHGRIPLAPAGAALSTAGGGGGGGRGDDDDGGTGKWTGIDCADATRAAAAASDAR